MKNRLAWPVPGDTRLEFRIFDEVHIYDLDPDRPRAIYRGIRGGY